LKRTSKMKSLILNKRQFKSIMVISILLIQPALCWANWDPLKPKINVGSLEEIDLSELPSLLSISIEEITKPWSPEETTTGFANSTEIKSYEVLPQRAYKQTVKDTNIEVYRVISYIMNLRRDDFYDSENYIYERIYAKNSQGIFILIYQDTIINDIDIGPHGNGT
jgi:hypothetical protein